MSLYIAVAIADLLRRTLARLALESLRMLAPSGLDTGMSSDVPVALLDLLRRALFWRALQLVRPLTSFLRVTHGLPPVPKHLRGYFRMRQKERALLGFLTKQLVRQLLPRGQRLPVDPVVDVIPALVGDHEIRFAQDAQVL